MNSGKTYWRSLAQKEGAPRDRSFENREFAEGVSEAPQGVSRRTMLTLMGASLSLAGLTACRRPVEKIVPFVTAPEDLLPGVARHYATTMPFGRSAYGLVVESHEGRPTKIEGNELHPSTLGASSPWIQAAILDLYDPDRLQPVQRAGEAVAWGEFEQTWAGLAQTFAANGGQGLAVLTEEFASPTLERLLDAFRARYPQARIVSYGPLGEESAVAGSEQVFGQAYETRCRFDRAAVVLALDSDFLMTDPEAVRHAMQFAEGRRIRGEHGSMSRLWSVESALTVTGGNADQRLRLRPGQLAGLLGLLATKLRSGGLALNLPAAGFPAVEGVEPHWVEALAHDLLENRGKSIILAGQGQPAEVHAAAMLLNSSLGNLGETITLHRSRGQGRSSRGELGDLADAMRGGQVSALFVLGGNPLYDAPADFEFAGALQGVEHSFHLASHLDETSDACSWHLPQAHFLESWGDARARGGALSVIQPLIRPLFGGRSNLELMALLATGETGSAYEHVRETWREQLGAGLFEKNWQQLLHAGLLQTTEGTAAQGTDAQGTDAVRPSRPGLDQERRIFAALGMIAPDEGAEALDLVFRPSATLYDGRFANNGWLQELPDPVTKITWDNAALLSPATARSLDVQHEQMVRLEYEGREMTLPVWVVPGQADRTVVVDLGHGRTAAGRVGNGQGFDVYRLRTSAAPGYGVWTRLQPTDETYAVAETQHHNEMDELGEAERDHRIPMLIREATLAEYRHKPDFVKGEEVEHPPLVSLWKEHSYEDGKQWGMSIDLNACIGCGTCAIACQSENNIPVVGKAEVANGREMSWIRVDRYFSGTVEQPEAVFQPVPCMHCENAPCEQVCPVAATTHDSEGLNTMVYNRCVGTRYCANNCPYKVRRFNFFNFTKDTPEVRKMANNPDVTVRSRGVMEKCSFCLQRINRARLDAKLAGREMRDGDVTTACEQACPTRAIRFGDIRDEESRVTQDKADPRNYVLLGELNNKPRVSYLGKLRNPHPDLGPAPGPSDHPGQPEQDNHGHG